jgi:TPR repeat protein
MSNANDGEPEAPATPAQMNLNSSIIPVCDGSAELPSAHAAAQSARDSQEVGNDPQKAANYFKLATDQGDAAAQFNYGVCLESGSGVQIDLQKAANYFKLAADQGDADA